MSAFKIYSIASGLATKADEVQRATLLHCLGLAVQRIFNTLPGVHEKYEDVQTALNGYFAPRRNVVAERHKIRSQAQGPGEPINPYLTALRELAKSCDFGVFEEEMIRDQIVEKCHSTTLRQKLLQQENLDLTKTMKIARSAETASQEALLLSGGSKENPIQIDHVAHGQHGSKPPHKYSCYRCGGADGHSASECGAINSRYNLCKKVGHLQKVCRSKPKGSDQKRNKQRPA